MLGSALGPGHRSSCSPSRYHRHMPDSHDDVRAHSDEISAEETPRREVSRSAVQIAPQGISRWMAPAALVIALVAVAVAIWSAMSPSTGGAGAANLSGDPKTRVCAAFDVVSKAVPLQTHMSLGPDPVAQAAVAANSRLALFGGGQYLLNSLDGGTPASLADPVRSFATSLQEIGINALAGVQNTDPAQSTRLVEADHTRQQIVDMCK